MSELEELKESIEELNTKIIESISEPAEEKPSANYYACSINPGKYDSLARKRCYKKSGGKCIDYLFGIKGGKSKLSSMWYKKSIWEKSAASSHCSSHNGKFEG